MSSKAFAMMVVILLMLIPCCEGNYLQDPCINYCEFTSVWSRWDCSGCVQYGGTIKRYRALCCAKLTKEECLTDCNKTDADITQTASCASICATTSSTRSVLQTTSSTVMTQSFSTMLPLHTSSNATTKQLSRYKSTIPVFQTVSTATISQSQAQKIITTRMYPKTSTTQLTKNVTTASISGNMSPTQTPRTMWPVRVPGLGSLSSMNPNASTNPVPVFLSPTKLSPAAISDVVTKNTPVLLGPSTLTSKISGLVSSTTNSINKVDTDNTADLDPEPGCRIVCDYVFGKKKCTQDCSESKQNSLCIIVSVGLFLLGMVIGAVVTAVTVQCCFHGNKNKHDNKKRHGTKNRPENRYKHGDINNSFRGTQNETFYQTNPYNVNVEHSTNDMKAGYSLSPVRSKKFRQISPVSSNSSLIYPWPDQDSPRDSPEVQRSIIKHFSSGFPGKEVIQPDFTIGTPNLNKRNNNARV